LGWNENKWQIITPVFTGELIKNIGNFKAARTNQNPIDRSFCHQIFANGSQKISFINFWTLKIRSVGEQLKYSINQTVNSIRVISIATRNFEG
jgi:hypothetical protein